MWIRLLFGLTLFVHRLSQIPLITAENRPNQTNINRQWPNFNIPKPIKTIPQFTTRPNFPGKRPNFPAKPPIKQTPNPTPSSTNCVQCFDSIYVPVCAIITIGLPMDYDNNCSACAPDTVKTLEGTCFSNLLICSSSRNCIPSTRPVCAFSEGRAPWTVLSGAVCCNTQPKDYQMILPGLACPIGGTTTPPSVQEVCPASFVMINCPNNNGINPAVCATMRNGIKLNYSSSCLACRDGAKSYKVGRCN